MPPKKKSKPSFRVPSDFESPPQAGWVYRSEEVPKKDSAAPAEESTTGPPASETAADAIMPEVLPVHVAWDHDSRDHHKSSDWFSSESSGSDSSGILDLSAKTLTSSVTAMSNAFMLGAAILSMPIRVGLWMAGFRSRD